jgi:hypothetical protein
MMLLRANMKQNQQMKKVHQPRSQITLHIACAPGQYITDNSTTAANPAVLHPACLRKADTWVCLYPAAHCTAWFSSQTT